VNYQALLDEIADDVRALPTEGDVARYIPELARVEPDQFGLALRRQDDTTFGAGDWNTRFSLQSMAKVLLLALACSLDNERVWSRVGVEPSGDPFNSLVQLEFEGGRPRNPLINAGALVVCDILLSLLDDPRAELLGFVRGLAGEPSIDFDRAVAQSELDTASRNRALAHFMKSFGNIEHSIDEVLGFYVHACSLSMSCNEVVQAFSFLAEHGVNMPADDRVLTVEQVRRLNAIMLTCGFYDESGDFAFHVGLPGKSGVGGGIVAVCPGRFTAAAWSPRLGAKGNSIRATEALRRLAQRSNASVF
jgi:glutaminase